MDNTAPQTPPANPDATDGQPPAATNPQGAGGATNDSTIPDGFELIKTEDKKNLISARDKANGVASGSEEYVLTLAKREEIDGFLEQNKKDFPDVVRDDLMSAESPEELKDLATARQKRYEDVVQKRLFDVQKTATPTLSPEQKTERLKTLQSNPGSKSFQEMLQIQQQG